MYFINRLFHWMIIIFWLGYGSLFIWSSLQNHSGVLPIIIGVNTVLFGYFLFVRRDGEVSPYSWYVQGVILCSIFLGNLYHYDQPAPLAGVIIGIVGSLLSLWALFSLGKSFGIAPANRGLVMRGPYQFIRHPMYLGYLLMDVPLLIWNTSVWNWGVFCVKIISFAIRILLEERVVSDYSEYQHRVQWRLIPFIW